MILLWKTVVLKVGVQWLQAHPQKVWFAENLGKNANKSCSKNGAQGLQKNTWRSFFEVTPKKRLNDLCGRNFVGKSCTKNWACLGKFGKRFFGPQKIWLLLHQWQKGTSDPITPLLKRQRGKCPRHASILQRPCAYYSTRALFTRCFRLQCVILMDIHYHRYPKTEQLITAKISTDALKERSSRTHSVLRQHSSQPQKCKAAQMSRRIVVDQRVCDWGGDHLGLTVWNL